MKVRNHLPEPGEGRVAAFAASPQTGGHITPRFLALHYTTADTALPVW